MNDFKKMIVDNWIFKIVLGLIALSSISAILFNSDLFTLTFLPYIVMSVLYFNLYTKNALTNKGKNYMTILHTVLYVLSYPGVLLYKLFGYVLKLILSIAKLTTPKFNGKGGKKWF